MSHIRQKAIDGLEIGDSFSIKRTFTISDINQFADISRDYNPVHFIEEFASAKNFTGPIAHGLLVAGMVTEIGGQIGWLASGMDFEFKKPVYAGDTIQCNFVITKLNPEGRGEASAILTNADGEVVLKAALYGIIPGGHEKAIMRQMVAQGDPTNRIHTVSVQKERAKNAD